jgi:hypothetical protein
MPLLQFGDLTGRTYDFTAAGKALLGTYRDNFAQVDSITHRSPGMSGAFDAYGQGVPPTKVGNIRQELTLLSEAGRSFMDTYRDELRAMVSWGKQRLYFRPENYPSQADRMCYAKVIKVDMPLNKEAHNLTQKATVEWEATDPRWCVALSGGGLWGVGAWGTALWGVAPTILSATADGNETTITYNGTVATPVLIEIVTDGSSSVSAPIIQRVIDGVLVDEVRYNAAISTSKQLLIDAHRHEARLQLVKFNDGTLVAKRARWFILEPGNNLIRFHCDAIAGTVSVRFWYDAYYR